MKKDIIQFMIALVLYIIALAANFNNAIINNVLFIIVYIIVGIEVLKEAIENIIKGELFDENFLMTIATIGAFAIGEFPEAAAVMLFYKLGEMFEEYATEKSRKSIANLMDIRPDYANIMQGEEIKKVKPDEVKINDIIVVKPGEKIPLDGVIIEGNSSLDTKALTGESIPREVGIDDEVLSGCINLNGVIKIKVIKEYGESTVSKILDLVENASNKKSKSENFITKFSKYYTPIVVIIAVILAIFPPILIKGEEFSTWIYRALSFLVVSCPCALVISIPLGFFGGIGGASKIGILIKGSNYIERLANIKTIIFDKTGTLTEGKFEVQNIKSVNMSEDELLKITAYAENYSTHPIAMSVKERYGKKIDEKQIKDTKELSGLGIEALIEKKKVYVGNEKLMKEKNICYEKCSKVGTALYVAIDDKYAGYILIADKIKNDSKTAIKELKKSNITKTIMLTGDKKSVGESVAKELEIDEVFAELMPDGKADILEKFLNDNEERNKGSVAFVGDGINDAPVLALADVGIAMGGLGSDSAIEAADVVIMTDEPSKIVNAIRISKKTMRIVRENIIFAIAVKVLVLVLSAFGISTMWQAVFADVGVTAIAIINALRTLKTKK